MLFLLFYVSVIMSCLTRSKLKVDDDFGLISADEQMLAYLIYYVGLCIIRSDVIIFDVNMLLGFFRPSSFVIFGHGKCCSRTLFHDRLM